MAVINFQNHFMQYSSFFVLFLFIKSWFIIVIYNDETVCSKRLAPKIKNFHAFYYRIAMGL